MPNNPIWKKITAPGCLEFWKREREIKELKVLGCLGNVFKYRSRLSWGFNRTIERGQVLNNVSTLIPTLLTKKFMIQNREVTELFWDSLPIPHIVSYLGLQFYFSVYIKNEILKNHPKYLKEVDFSTQ